MLVSWGSQKLNIDVDINKDVSKVREILSSLTDVPVERIKLIQNGRLLPNGSVVQDAPITMIGTADIITVQNEDDESMRDPTKPHPYKNKRVYRPDQPHPEYRFASIKTLAGFADQDKAREILEGLANDHGILAVLKKHRWRVGALCELAPDGKVGVDPVCVLGLNQNAGQRILLRIRTDDLKGFRKRLSIRKVLYHELAHNVHGDHDDDFYRLMRQIEREATELDWRKGKGRQLGQHPVENIFAFTDDPGVFPPTREDDAEGPEGDEEDVDEDTRWAEAVAAAPADSQAAPQVDPVVLSEITQTTEISDPEPVLKEDTAAVQEPEPTVAGALVYERILGSVDDGIAVAMSLGSGVEERLLRMREALATFVIRNIDVGGEPTSLGAVRDAIETLSLIHSIVNKARTSSEEKHQSVKASAAKFVRVVRVRGACPVLEAAGFEERSVGDHTTFTLARNDPGLLYVMEAQLSSALTTMQEFIPVQ